MGIIDKLLRHKNPTYGWTANHRVILQCDWSNDCFCNIELGSPLERCSFLGSGRFDGDIWYDDKGLAICAEDGRLTGFVLYFGHADEPDHGRYSGEFLLRGGKVKLSAATSDEEFRQQLGEPYWQDRDEDETLLFYEHHRAEWQIEFGRDRRLKTIIVTDEPLLADPETRTAYGVTKPWPPEASPEAADSPAMRTECHTSQGPLVLGRPPEMLKWKNFKLLPAMLLPLIASSASILIRHNGAMIFEATATFIVGGMFTAVLSSGFCTGVLPGRSGAAPTVNRHTKPIRFWFGILCLSVAYVGICFQGFVI